ncbi:MAG: tetratricopeptide repeat protein [Myxococcales bacterium]|nr:tetratricopeptide repeat protein [Myxococcales bacterium]
MGKSKGSGFASLALLTALLALLFGGNSSAARAQSGGSAVPGLPAQPPQAYAVMPFENRSGIAGIEWMRLAVPFVLAERAEGFSRLRPGYDEMVVRRLPRAKDTVSDADIIVYAKQLGVQWVVTGWLRRPDWKLELGVSLYRVNAGKATKVAEYVGTGEFKEVHTLIGKALLAVTAEARLRHADDDLELIRRESSTDFYAFTLFGRALGGMLAAVTAADRDKAGQTMQRAVFIEPTFTEAQRLFARDQHRRFKPVLAKARLEAVLEERPAYTAALVSLAKAALDRKQFSLAEDVMEKVVRVRPWDLEVRYELAMLYWRQGRSPEAFDQLTIVADNRPRHIRARRALVLIHAKRSDIAHLVEELKEVAALAPKDVDTQLELGAALVAADSIDEAIAVYKGITVIDALNVQALKFLGDLYRRQGKTQRAIRQYGLAIKAAPKDPRSYFLLGAMYVEEGKDKAARRIYLKAQRFPKWRGEAFNNLGAIELRRNRPAQGVWYLRRAVQRDGRRAGYRYNLALGLSKIQASDEAMEHIDSALALDSGHGESHYLRGVILLRLGRAEEARAAFVRTIEANPAHEDAAHNMALLDAMKRRALHGEVTAEGK